MNAETLDKQFDEGANIINALDLSKAKRGFLEEKRVNVDTYLSFPRSTRRSASCRRSGNELRYHAGAWERSNTLPVSMTCYTPTQKTGEPDDAI